MGKLPKSATPVITHPHPPQHYRFCVRGLETNLRPGKRECWAPNDEICYINGVNRGFFSLDLPVKSKIPSWMQDTSEREGVACAIFEV